MAIEPPLDETDTERIKREHPKLWHTIFIAVCIVLAVVCALVAFVVSLLLIRACWWLTEAIL